MIQNGSETWFKKPFSKNVKFFYELYLITGILTVSPNASKSFYQNINSVKYVNISILSIRVQ
jgi:hypothetical protein